MSSPNFNKFFLKKKSLIRILTLLTLLLSVRFLLLLHAGFDILKDGFFGLLKSINCSKRHKGAIFLMQQESLSIKGKFQSSRFL